MAYTYRFIDTNNNVIYVGYTAQRLNDRMNQHFTKGHLSPQCYDSVARIEYIEWKTKSDAQVMEVYYINKYKGKYNRQDKQNDTLTIRLEEKNWKTYKVLKTAKNTNNKVGWFNWILIALLLYYLIQYLMG